MITIRPATENDLPQILDIYNEIIAHTTAVYYYEPHTLDMRRQWFRERREQGFPVFVAEEDGQILGMSTIGPFRVPTAYKFSVENTVHVAARARGKGVGKLLMPPIIEAARQLGMHTIVAGIDATNEVSIRLHKNFGFEEVAHFKEVGYKFNRWLDLKFLQLILLPAKPEVV
ncbi:MAG TPA: N-acetyltransferase family protein [Ferruginibacter sp.]|nr:N-acetyltransferase family protein [Ferruginibacter sp.]